MDDELPAIQEEEEEEVSVLDLGTPQFEIPLSPASEELWDSFPSSKFICGGCGKEYTSIVRLTKHMQVHDPSRPYECVSCGWRYLKYFHLRAHEEVHKKVRMKPQRTHNNRQHNRELLKSLLQLPCATLVPPPVPVINQQSLLPTITPEPAHQHQAHHDHPYASRHMGVAKMPVERRKTQEVSWLLDVSRKIAALPDPPSPRRQSLDLTACHCNDYNGRKEPRVVCRLPDGCKRAAFDIEVVL